jgi:CRP/FNR family cyclic AMP-dependent transcriptional regulator
MSANPNLLSTIPVFSLLDSDERATLSELLEVERFSAGQLIYDIGDVGDCLYVVSSGHVHVYSEDAAGEQIVLGEHDAGGVFGEISLLDGGPRTNAAMAMEPCELLSLSRECLVELVTSHPHAALDVLTHVGQRLRHTDELMRSHVSRNANVEEAESLTVGQRIADRVAAFGGSWTFILIFCVIIGVWMFINTAALLRMPFDPYPYILLNLVLSTLAAFQAPVIMMSQNRQAQKDRIKSELDYAVNLKAELEVANLHQKIDKIYERLQVRWATSEKEKKAGDKTNTPNDYY